MTHPHKQVCVHGDIVSQCRCIQGNVTVVECPKSWPISHLEKEPVLKLGSSWPRTLPYPPKECQL